MALSKYDERQLELIKGGLEKDHPDFFKAFTGRGYKWLRRRWDRPMNPLWAFLIARTWRRAILITVFYVGSFLAVVGLFVGLCIGGVIDSNPTHPTEPGNSQLSKYGFDIMAP